MHSLLHDDPLELVDIDLTSPGQCHLHFLKTPYPLPEETHQFMVERGLHVSTLVSLFVMQKLQEPSLCGWSLADAVMVTPRVGLFFLAPLARLGPSKLRVMLGRIRRPALPDRCAQIQVSELAADLEVRHLTLAQDAWEIQRLPVAASLYLFSSLLRRRLAELGYAFVFSNTGISGK